MAWRRQVSKRYGYVGTSLPGKGSKYKDLVTRVGLQFSRTSRKPTVSGEQWVRERRVGNMVREGREIRLCCVMLRTLTFTQSEKGNIWSVWLEGDMIDHIYLYYSPVKHIWLLNLPHRYGNRSSATLMSQVTQPGRGKSGSHLMTLMHTFCCIASGCSARRIRAPCQRKMSGRSSFTHYKCI